MHDIAHLRVYLKTPITSTKLFDADNFYYIFIISKCAFNIIN